MNVEYINPIIQAATYVLREMCGLEVSVSKPYLSQVFYEEKIFIVMIGITGELHGQVILGMKENVACDMAQHMMMGMPVNELNDMAKSALGELMNMTMGNAVTEFFNRNIKLDITPPTMALSNNIDIRISNTKMICIPIIYNNSNLIELHVAIKDKDKQ